jgi:hypothetical protein
MIAPNPKITASTIRTPPSTGWGVSSPINSSGDRRGADRLAALTLSCAYRPPAVCGSSATRRSRVTSHTVTLLPHQSAASGSTGPLSSVIVRSASPAPLTVSDCSVALTERGQHLDRQTREPAVPVDTFSAPRRLGVERS